MARSLEHTIHLSEFGIHEKIEEETILVIKWGQIYLRGDTNNLLS